MVWADRNLRVVSPAQAAILQAAEAESKVEAKTAAATQPKAVIADAGQSMDAEDDDLVEVRKMQNHRISAFKIIARIGGSDTVRWAGSP